ncbi:hypothetical protein GCM10017776_61790 [Streptomyces griseoluteus]|nr:hypothetical protein GCM10017776_61790 [Streptomyces griseoluteus]
MAFAAGANGLVIGLGAPTHVEAPVFDAKLPRSWLVDLSHVDLPRMKVGKDTWADLDASLLPSPFTPKGERPQGPAWYATPTVAYAVELGYDVTPIEAYVRHDNGRYLDGWYQRLRRQRPLPRRLVPAAATTTAATSTAGTSGCATPTSPPWPTWACTRTWSRPTSWPRWTATRTVTRSWRSSSRPSRRP